MDTAIDLGAAWITLKLASITAGVVTLVGIPISYWITVTQSPTKNWIRTLLSLPLVLPPTVLGFYLLCSFTALKESLDPYGIPVPRLAFTFEGLVVGSLFYSLPFALQSYLHGFHFVRRDWVHSSYCLGVSRFQTFLKLTLPLALPFILNGTLLSFAHTLGEFGVVLMVGGSIPGVSRTLSVSLYDDVQAMKNQSAHVTAGALLLFSIVSLGLSSRLVPLRRNFS